MKKSVVKITSLCLCASLALGGLGVYALAAGEAPAGASEEPRQLSAAAETSDAVKDETVYILAESDGAVQKVIVSDWLTKSCGKRIPSGSLPGGKCGERKGRRDLYCRQRRCAGLGCPGKRHLLPGYIREGAAGRPAGELPAGRPGPLPAGTCWKERTGNHPV